MIKKVAMIAMALGMVVTLPAFASESPKNDRAEDKRVIEHKADSPKISDLVVSENEKVVEVKARKLYNEKIPTVADILGETVAHKITDERNPYDLPLYDNLTLNADLLGIDYFEQNPDENEMLKYCSTAGNYTYTQEARGFFNPKYSAYAVAYSPYAEAGSKTPITLVDGRLLVAVAPKLMMEGGQDLTYRQAAASGYSGLAKNGTYFDVVFDDGTVLACMVGDTKGDDGDLYTYDYWGHRAGNKVNLIEIIQWTPEEAGERLPLNSSGRSSAYAYSVAVTQQNGLPSNGQWGANYGSIIGLDKNIEKIVIYDADHYNSENAGGEYTSWTEKQEELEKSL